jgi:hypothetical protein
MLHENEDIRNASLSQASRSASSLLLELRAQGNFAVIAYEARARPFESGAERFTLEGLSLQAQGLAPVPKMPYD